MATGHLAGSGLSDIVFAAENVGIGYLKNTGPGTFGPIVSAPQWFGGTGLALAPLRGGSVDQVLATGTNAFGVLSAAAPYDGGLSLLATYPANAPGPLAVGDFNGDGRPDVALLSAGAPDGGPTMQIFARQCP